jgi:tripeptidyl-peptidase I
MFFSRSCELLPNFLIVSDPEHHRYGSHMSPEEVHDLIKPSEEALDSIHEWLNDNGVDTLTYSPAKDWIHATIPVELAELLLDTKYSTYKHEDGSQVVRTTSWSIPKHIHEHVDSIQPTTSFLRFAPKNVEFLSSRNAIQERSESPPTDPELAKLCYKYGVSPACFKALYKINDYKPTAKGNEIAFTNYLSEVPIRPDLDKFLHKYVPQASPNTASIFPQISIADGPTQDGPITPAQINATLCKEANLDVQSIHGMVYPIPVTSYSTGGSPPSDPVDNDNEPYEVWLNYILALKSIPQVISTSYADEEQTVPTSYASRVCRQFAQLGARGVSVLFASGDDGVGTNGTCLSNDGLNTTMFLPLFPSGCPYVTTVGATMNFGPERVAERQAVPAGTLPPAGTPDGKAHSDYRSGGGFSNYFPQPAYQKDAVQSYVKGLRGQYKGLYNTKGRAYPDLSAQGLYFAYFWNGTESNISGTSASTPLMSGILALVNDALLSTGRPALGFLNPWLYKTGYKAFTDITAGSAVGCNTTGFPAVKGWDAVTGFGTPIFPKLVELAKAPHYKREAEQAAKK